MYFNTLTYVRNWPKEDIRLETSKRLSLLIVNDPKRTSLKCTGLSKGTIYLCFESKNALFTHLIESLKQPNVAKVETIDKIQIYT